MSGLQEKRYFPASPGVLTFEQCPPVDTVDGKLGILGCEHGVNVDMRLLSHLSPVFPFSPWGICGTCVLAW